MAFVDQTDEEKQAQQGQQNPNALIQTPQTAGGAVSGPGGGVSSAVPPGGVGAQPAAGKAPPVQNLTAYLQANAPQAQGMADRIATDLSAGATKAQNNIATAGQQFQGQIQAGSVQPDQALIQKAAANPTEFVKDPNNVTAFTKQRDASYTGPQNFEGSKFYSDLNNEITSAVGKAGSVDPQNIGSLVQRYETNPTPGMTALDSLVLKQNPGAINTIKTSQAPYASLAKALQDLTAGQNQSIDAARTATAAAPVAVKQAFDPLTQTFKSGLTAAQQKAQADADAYNKSLGSYTGALSADQPFKAALDASNLRPLINMPDPFSAAPAALPRAPNLSNVASSDDFQKQAALEQLLGSGFNGPLNEAEASQAGTFSIPGTVPNTPDLDAILNEITGKTAGGATSQSYATFGNPTSPEYQAYEKFLKELMQNYSSKIGTGTHWGGVIGGGVGQPVYYVK